MKWECWWIGKIKTDYIRAGVLDYRERIQRMFSLKFRELPEAKSKTEQAAKESQALTILKLLRDEDRLILLDEHGKQFRSIEFAAYLEEQMTHGPARLVFVVGGPFGFTEELINRAYQKISLSRMTYSHEMAILVFMEQFYRALTIKKGIPYHNE